MILSNSSGITAAGDLAIRILAFVRDSFVLVRLLTGQSIELIRLGTRMNRPKGGARVIRIDGISQVRINVKPSARLDALDWPSIGKELDQ